LEWDSRSCCFFTYSLFTTVEYRAISWVVLVFILKSFIVVIYVQGFSSVTISVKWGLKLICYKYAVQLLYLLLCLQQRDDAFSAKEDVSCQRRRKNVLLLIHRHCILVLYNVSKGKKVFIHTRCSIFQQEKGFCQCKNELFFASVN